MKQYAQPDAAEVALLEQFIDQTLWGTIQNRNNGMSSLYFEYYRTDKLNSDRQDGQIYFFSKVFYISSSRSQYTFINLLRFPAMSTPRTSTLHSGGRGIKHLPLRQAAPMTTYM